MDSVTDYRAHYKTLFDQIPEPAWVVNLSDLQFLEVNAAAIEIFGYTRDEYLSMNLENLHSAEQVKRLREAVRRSQFFSPDLCAWKTLKKDGSRVEMDLRMRPVTFPQPPSGEIPALIVLAVDASTRNRLEDQLRQAQKMEAIGMLAGGIAHDFNNLLTIISGYSQMLLSSTGEQDPDRGPVEQILKASQRAADLTRQLLAFSRRKRVQPKVIDLKAAVAGMSPMLHRLIGEHIDLKIEAAAEAGYVHADPGQIEQIIMNLAVNARDAMAAGGKLVIETGNAELDETYVAKHLGVRPGHYVMLAVTDTGTGMDAKTQAQVFEPFFTTKGHGTGLGLSTVYGIVKQSGGAIDLYSEPGFGTSVKVYLPRVDEDSRIEIKNEPRESPGGWETILLAEDEEAVRLLVQKALEKAGYRLLLAASGGEAVKLAQAQEGEIHLLITDMVMPRMSGKALARKFHKLRPETAVLFISGYTDASLQHGGSLTSDLNFLQKPFSPAALKQKVREVLDARGNGNGQSDRAGK
ncbi:MAG: response regulator [Acidobacteriota bacterium]|nr:response regulator [Acidobacteriota bacterium]